MPKTVQSDVKTEFQKEANEPVFLIIIELDDTTLYFTDYSEDLNFPTSGGHTYSSWGFDFSQIKTTLSLEQDRMQFRFDNTDLVFSTTYVKNNKFQGRRLTLYKVPANKLAVADNAVVLFSGDMGAPKSADGPNESNTMLMVISDFGKLRASFPGRDYSGPCRRKFDGVKCRGTEIITNPGFEGTYVSGVAPDWTKDGTPTVSEETTYIHGGSSAQKILNTDSFANSIKQGPFGENGKTYEVTAYVMRTAGTGKADIADSNPLGNTHHYHTFSQDDVFEEFTFIATATGSGYIYLCADNTDTTIIWDDISRREVLADPKTGAVEAGSSTVLIIDTANRTEADGYWNNGIIEITSGVNDGEIRMVKESNSSGNIDIIIPLPNTPGIGDTYSIERGCDKTAMMCKMKHDNWINFGGFKALPKE